MDDGLKQRLVGAVVLAALAVIFLPSLFDQDNRRRVSTTSKIPPVKSVGPATFKAPIREAGIPQAKSPDEMYQLVDEPEVAKPETKLAIKPATKPVASQPVAKPVPKPSLNQQGVPKAWVIQVASFKTETRAKVLRDKLISQGYKAYIRSLKTSKGPASRVLVGPKIDQREAQKVKARLDRALKVDTLIKRFEP